MPVAKTVYLIIISLLVLILMFDTFIYYTSISNFHDAIDQALDAGLVAGVHETDGQRGRMIITEDLGYTASKESISTNLRLNIDLDNEFYHGSSWDFQIIMKGEHPVAVGVFRTKIELLCLKILGQEGMPYSIRKTQNYAGCFI